MSLGEMNCRVQVVSGLRDAAPIAVAYIPVAVTFGVISTSNGIPVSLTLLISAWVYAGGAQFMMVGLALANAAEVSTIVAVLLVNLRHFLYGTTLGPAFAKWPEWAKWVCAYGLTDEVFTVSSARNHADPPDQAYQFPFVFSCYAAWVAGTILGACVGRVVSPTVASVLGFTLPALFLALLLNSTRSMAHACAAVAGGLGAILANLVHLGRFGIAIGAVIGATIGLCISRIRS